MSEAKFTKGPWSSSTLGPLRLFSRNGDGVFVAEAENETDAHLIAAAPELYEALELAIEIMDEAGWNRPVQRVCREALSKARGES